MLPLSLRSVSDLVVSEDGVDSGFRERRRQAQRQARQGVCPCRIKEKIPLFVKHWETVESEGQLGIAIEHDDDDAEEDGAHVLQRVVYCVLLHCRSEENRHRYQTHDSDLRRNQLAVSAQAQ